MYAYYMHITLKISDPDFKTMEIFKVSATRCHSIFITYVDLKFHNHEMTLAKILRALTQGVSDRVCQFIDCVAEGLFSIFRSHKLFGSWHFLDESDVKNLI